MYKHIYKAVGGSVSVDIGNVQICIDNYFHIDKC